MDKDKLQQLWEPDVKAERELEKLRTPMTILFSDIKGSTTFAEKKGDVEYMAMIDRHNRILFPVIEAEGGRVDRKSTRLNSSHSSISYAVFCLKKKKR